MIRVPCPSTVLSIISGHFSCQYHVSWVDCNSSGMCSKQVGVFEDSYQIPFCSLLQKSVCMQLEANIFLGIVTNFKTKPSNGRNGYDKTGFLLIVFNFFQCKLTRLVPAIGEFISEVVKNSQLGKITAGIFLDSSKAFDTLEHLVVYKKTRKIWHKGKSP